MTRKEYLFKKHLSKLSIGPLMELYREVGETFRAVKQTGELRERRSPETDALGELDRMRRERATLVCTVKRRLKGYQREHRRLKQENEQQKALIAKYKAMVQCILQEGGVAGR
ncbi:FAD dependent oxidoreductase [Purpureocillium lavendulum]|uniref:FAD dependent oxidoreductase n=1 Tax=Purpureocillium lavendulum TaxID=1247861 RepID=A0AB34FBY6_9HYPO|nr:FAD dependent oxidoreductase [Purpureocillium lavendulum]